MVASSPDKFKIMQNPRCKKGLNLQHTVMILYFTISMQKASLRCFNLPKVQREFCQRATNQQKENWGIFQVFPLRISIWSNVRTATVYWKCIGGNGEESIWRFRKKWKITKYSLFFFVSHFFHKFFHRFLNPFFNNIPPLSTEFFTYFLYREFRIHYCRPRTKGDRKTI